MPHKTQSHTQQLTHLKSLLTRSEIVHTDSASYVAESLPWGLNRDESPSLVIRPTSLSTLSTAIAYLTTDSTLDFSVRSQGYGSASAKDVLISLSAFDEFSLDKENNTLILGAGQPWSEYYRKMEEVAPELTIVACRTPCIGVGGSVLSGGFSWLSGEFGCVSDPENLLDAQVVKVDGSVIWASEEPELLWALRGTQTGFGVVTAFKFRVRPYTQKIWAGPILLPNTRETLEAVAKGIVSMDVGPREPKIAMFLYLMQKEIIQALGGKDDMLVVHAYDAVSEDHGREAFKWAFQIDGALDRTAILNSRGVADMQAGIAAVKGKATSYWNSIALPNLTEDIIFKAFDWHDNGLSKGSPIKDSLYLLFELFCTRDSLSGRTASAWPRPAGAKHVVLLGTGTKKGASVEEDAMAKQLCADGAAAVLGEKVKADIMPNAIEDFHDIKATYAENYPKLQELKRRYDPDNRLKGLINPL